MLTTLKVELLQVIDHLTNRLDTIHEVHPEIHLVDSIKTGREAIANAQCVEENDQEIRVFLDGDLWCALRGEDLRKGESCFGDTPIQALVGWLELYGPNGAALKERHRNGEKMAKNAAI